METYFFMGVMIVMIMNPNDHSSKNEIWLRLALIVALILLVMFGVMIAHLIRSGRALPSNAIAQSGSAIRLDTQTSKFILKNGIPFLEKMVDEDDPLTFLNINWIEIYWHLAANISNTSPLEIIRTQFPLLALIKVQPTIPKITLMPIENQPEVKQELPEPSPEEQGSISIPQLGLKPEVFIYHTHTTESYIPACGKDHTVNQKGDIVKVGSYLQKVLEEKYHINCMHSETIHDQFPFRDSYKRSQVTVINYLKQYPSTKVVLDVHRDATPGLESSRMVKGVKCATIVTVVGSDKMGLAHPRWKENLQFAKKLNENMDLFFPGLSNGIIISDARYNQHLHTHAILIEFGDQYTTLEEAYHAVDFFAEVLVHTMQNDPSPGVTNLEAMK
jgi:stage II sporulation protein P